MVHHQSFQEWLQNPMQGAIPAQTPLSQADEAFLIETLVECRTRLSSALETAKTYDCLPELATGLGDALTGCDEALTVIQNPQNYIE